MQMLSNQGNKTFHNPELEQLKALGSEIETLRIDQKSMDIFMQAPVGICILKGPQFILQFANEAMLHLWGKLQHVIGLPILDVLPEMHGQEYYAILQSVYTSGTTYKANESEVMLVRNGVEEVRYVNFSNQALMETDGVISGVLVVAVDVTETVLSRKRIEDSEIKLRNIIEQTPTPILILKGEEFILEVANQPLFDLWKAGEEALGKPFLEILPEMKDQVFLKLLKNVFTTGETYYGYETPAVFYRKNGKIETVFVNFVYQPYRLTSGAITGVIVLATDVTEQVLAKQELVRSEARHRLAVEAALIGTYEIDIASQSIIHNARTAEIFGYPSTAKIRYDTLINAVHPEDRSVRLTAHETSKKTGELHYEARIVLPDNTINWVRLNGKVFTNDSSMPVMIGTVLDISQEKKAAELLEQKIKDRTKELMEANAQLEKFNVELEQFTHISSHDLQEPLRKINLYAGMVANQGSQDLDEITKKHIGKIKESAERMSATLTALLSYTQLKNVEQLFDIDLNILIAGVLIDLEVVIAEKEAQVLFEKLPVIQGVPHQIQQLFYNLINNALKFSRKAVPPQISIKVTEVFSTDDNPDAEKHAPYWQFIVEDNGVGFEQRFSEKIFIMFQRLHTKHAYTGTGIGLSLCKKIVENHKGLIWATSVVDHGSKFYILIPVYNITNSV